MNNKIENFTRGKYKCSLYLPEDYYRQDRHYPVVYVNGELDINDIMSKIGCHFGIDCDPFILTSIQPENWNDDFTPWIAPALRKDEIPFGGHGSDYIKVLINEIKPYIDTNYNTMPEPSDTALVGYSLGGLMSLYALYNSDIFGRIGCLSGSLWYDAWIEYMQNHMPVDKDAKVYLSMGISEKHSRNPRMAAVGDCIKQAFDVLSAQLASSDNLVLEWNNGGHFNDIPQRFVRALLWLMK